MCFSVRGEVVSYSEGGNVSVWLSGVWLCTYVRACTPVRRCAKLQTNACMHVCARTKAPLSACTASGLGRNGAVEGDLRGRGGKSSKPAGGERCRARQGTAMLVNGSTLGAAHMCIRRSRAMGAVKRVRRNGTLQPHSSRWSGREEGACCNGLLGGQRPTRLWRLESIVRKADVRKNNTHTHTHT